MAATTTPMNIMDDYKISRLRDRSAGHPRARGCHESAVAEISRSGRMRALASFLECDASILAEGLCEAVQDDPALRAQLI